MAELNRREMMGALAGLAALGSVGAEAQDKGPVLAHSQLFPFDKLPMTHSSNGGESRQVVHGTLATGEFVEVHETMLPAGQMPHPPHRHTHSEFLMIREGHVEAVTDGLREVIGPGGVIFTASGVLHSLKNIGETPANYFVVAVGVQKVIPV